MATKLAPHRQATPVALETRRLSFSYGEFQLQPMNFSVRRGELLTIIGPNASGKSTLLKLLAGLLTPEGGAVLLDSRPVGGLTRRERARRWRVRAGPEDQPGGRRPRLSRLPP